MRNNILRTRVRATLLMTICGCKSYKTKAHVSKNDAELTAALSYNTQGSKNLSNTIVGAVVLEPEVGDVLGQVRHSSLFRNNFIDYRSFRA